MFAICTVKTKHTEEHSTEHSIEHSTECSQDSQVAGAEEKGHRYRSERVVPGLNDDDEEEADPGPDLGPKPVEGDRVLTRTLSLSLSLPLSLLLSAVVLLKVDV